MTKEKKEVLRTLGGEWKHVELHKFQEGDRTKFKYWHSLEEYALAHSPPQNFVPFQARRFCAEQKRRIEKLLNKYGVVKEMIGVFDKHDQEISLNTLYEKKYPEYIVGRIPDFYRGGQKVIRRSEQFLREGEAAHEATKDSRLIFKID